MNRLNFRAGLSFRVLEAGAGLGLAGLFTLHHAGIPGQKAFFAHRQTKRVIQLRESACYAVRNRTGLAIYATAHHIDKNIVLTAYFGRFKGTHDLPFGAGMTAKELFQGVVIDDELALAFNQPDPGGRVLAPASGPNRILKRGGGCHG
jgi:hypothetical protein